MSVSIGNNPAASSTKPETFMLSAEQLDKLPQEAKQALEQVDDLKYFLATAPANWQVDQIIRRYLLPTGEYVSCVLWKNLFHITGTDIVRALAYRFEAFGRPVRNVKKFEEGIFSDLRNLKPGSDASLEEPKSAFLDLLYKNNCIRTQKKQKVFYWFSVPHDRLFLDALERDLKRERMGTETTTVAIQEPALSFVFDASQSLYEQLTKSLQQSAASEVRASLAAQQAHHNMMAHLQGSSTRFSLDSAHSEPSYRGRSHSIVSAVPIDYRDQDSVSRQPMFLMPTIPLQNGRQSRITSLTQDYMADNLGPNYDARQAAHGHQEFDHSDANFTQPYADGVEMYDDEPSYSMGHTAQPFYADYDEGYAVVQPQRDRSSTMVNNDFAAPYDMPGIYQNHQAELQGYHLPQPTIDVVPGRSISRKFSMIEGSATYKQRRRRQSIPSSLILAGQAQEARARQQRANGQMQGAADYQSYATDPSQSNFTLPNDSYNRMVYEDALLQQQYEDQGHPASRTNSVMEYGSPYATKSLACPVAGCARAFKHLEHLKRHVKTHNQTPPFICTTCGKKFARLENFVQHQTTHEERADADVKNDYAGLSPSQKDYRLEQVNLESMSEYSDFTGTKSLSAGEFGSRYSTEERLCFHDPAELTLNHESDEDVDVSGGGEHEVAKLRKSLEVLSPRSLAGASVSSAVNDSTSRDSQMRKSSSSSAGSTSYVSEHKEEVETRSAAPRSLYNDEWLDEDATPRQMEFGSDPMRMDSMKINASPMQMW